MHGIRPPVSKHTAPSITSSMLDLIETGCCAARALLGSHQSSICTRTTSPNPADPDRSFGTDCPTLHHCTDMYSLTQYLDDNALSLHSSHLCPPPRSPRKTKTYNATHCQFAQDRTPATPSGGAMTRATRDRRRIPQQTSLGSCPRVAPERPDSSLRAECAPTVNVQCVARQSRRSRWPPRPPSHCAPSPLHLLPARRPVPPAASAVHCAQPLKVRCRAVERRLDARLKPRLKRALVAACQPRAEACQIRRQRRPYDEEGIRLLTHHPSQTTTTRTRLEEVGFCQGGGGEGGGGGGVRIPPLRRRWRRDGALVAHTRVAAGAARSASVVGSMWGHRRSRRRAPRRVNCTHSGSNSKLVSRVCQAPQPLLGGVGALPRAYWRRCTRI